MNFSRVSSGLFVSALAGLLLSSCAAANEAPPSSPQDDSSNDAIISGNLVGSGASSQAAAQETWIAHFQTQNEQVNVSYDPVGSGSGRESFQQNATHFTGSDRAFTHDEIADGPFLACAADSDLVQLPVYISPISIVFNVEGVSSLRLDAQTVANIFNGTITMWDDQAIAEQNPNATLPNLSITAIHRSDKSGTTGNFTDYLASAAPEQWTEGSVEEWPTEYGGEGANGTSGVIEAVKNGVGTIGYADASRADGLSSVEILVGSEYVPFSPEAAAKIVDASPTESGRADTDIAISLQRDSSESGVYPIVLVSYLIGCQEYENPETAALVKHYFNYIASAEGQNAAAISAGNAPISDELRSRIEEAIDSIS